jgi:hypothetical protein
MIVLHAQQHQNSHSSKAQQVRCTQATANTARVGVGDLQPLRLGSMFLHVAYVVVLRATDAGPLLPQRLARDLSRIRLFLEQQLQLRHLSPAKDKRL